MIYYVSPNGNDRASGRAGDPFKTINHAASVAVAGDTVRVHGGVYREWVDPKNSGTEDNRIVYEAVEGELPIIKGSEVITDWERVDGSVWKKSIPNEIFNGSNPFATELWGDWLLAPEGYFAHLGDVYLNGVSLFEAASLEDLKRAEMRTNPKIRYPELSVYQWYADVTDDSTELYCNFGEHDPNCALTEISVRPACFFPKRTGVGYITVRGFEMAHAATQWSPPTTEQTGMIGPNWSRGWIIENNHLHDAKCCIVCLGTGKMENTNMHTRYQRKSGYQYQLEAVCSAIRDGWSRETVGSHVVRNNLIHDCGQTGIVGHMGCAFSRIEHNHIYNVNVKQEFWGYEIAGIKLHAPVDTVIENNNIHNCNMGIWLDWQAQGTRVTRNVLFENERDFTIEVTHGPCIMDHNLFMSYEAFDNVAQGTAYLHNLFCGSGYDLRVVDRSTPYHYPHSTQIAGFAFTYGGDDRVMNNMIIGAHKPPEYVDYFSHVFNRYNTPEDFKNQVEAKGIRFDHDKYHQIAQPVWVEENAYSGEAKPYRAEIDPIVADGMEASIKEVGGEWILTLTVPDEIAAASCKIVDTERLGTPRITEAPYENTDGTPIVFDTDITGEKRGERIVPGPIASLKAGVNRIVVWRE